MKDIDDPKIRHLVGCDGFESAAEGDRAVTNPADGLEIGQIPQATDVGSAHAKGLPFGLASNIFTNALERPDQAAAGLRAGMVRINHFGFAFPATSFGGVRDSVYGSQGGTETFDCDLSTTLISRNSAPTP